MGHSGIRGGQTGPQGAGKRTVARQPRQMRGQERVNAILDAAAAEIAEHGLAGVSMHALARRARTSIGSLYHFFPDRGSVLGALTERHHAALREISRRQADVPAAVWQRLSPQSAIERLVTPYIEYLRRHEDALPLMLERQLPEDDADFVRVIRRLVDVRLPNVAPGDRENYASILHATGIGTVRAGCQTDPLRSDVYLREAPRVMAAYLASLEAQARRARPDRRKPLARTESAIPEPIDPGGPGG